MKHPGNSVISGRSVGLVRRPHPQQYPLGRVQWKLLVLVAAIIVSGLAVYYVFFSTHEKIVCNQFELEVVLVGYTLVVSLDTDLPDATDVIIQLSRAYERKYPTGEKEVSVANHYRKKSTVSEWRTARRILINTERWRAGIKKQQRRDEKAGLGRFKVENVSDQIEFKMTVPTNQSDPRFGKRNRNLVGKAVTKITSGRIVGAEATFNFPIQAR